MYKNPHARDSGIDITYDDAVSPSPSPKPLEEIEQQQQQQHTPAPAATLLTLPLELRLEIYSYLLHVPSTPSTAKKPAHQLAAGFALLQTCRQLQDECAAYLLARNEFTAHPSLLASFPRLLGPGAAPVKDAAQAARIRRLRVPVRLDIEAHGFDAAEAARQLSGRRAVVLEARQSDWRAVGPGNLRLFEQVRGVGEARVEGSTGGFEDYARWLERTMMCGPGEDVGPFCGKDHLLTLYD
ncbi:hypothetical protein SLS62_009129 [Diatrype stigma]|uniref:F-box domain-containing protein n=1 Tax=Diatrype stigma TaxID=117547 RepID=A0AAN9UG97_9PEZI